MEEDIESFLLQIKREEAIKETLEEILFKEILSEEQSFIEGNVVNLPPKNYEEYIIHQTETFSL